MEQIKKRTGRILAMLLALAMVVTSVPQYALTVSAAEATEDVEIAEEQSEAEHISEADTQIVAAQQEEETTVTQQEGGNTAENAVTEEKTETGTKIASEIASEIETETKSEAQAVTGTETVSEAETQDSTETETATEEETSGEATDNFETEQKIRVSIAIPCGKDMDGKVIRPVNYLERFEYAIVDEEITDGNIPFQIFDGTGLYDGETLNPNETNIELEVPQGNTLYFKFILKSKPFIVNHFLAILILYMPQQLKNTAHRQKWFCAVFFILSYLFLMSDAAMVKVAVLLPT